MGAPRRRRTWRRRTIPTFRILATYHPLSGWTRSSRRTLLTLDAVDDLHESGVSLVRVKKSRRLEELSISRLRADLDGRSTPIAW